MTVKTLKVYYCDVPDCASTATAQVGDGAPSGWTITSTKRQHRCPDHLLVRCSGCARLIRSNRLRGEDYPQAVVAYSMDVTAPLCRACHLGRQPVESVSENDAKFIRRLIATRFDDPDDRLLVLDHLGLLGTD